MGISCRPLWVFNIEHRLDLYIRALIIASGTNLKLGLDSSKFAQEQCFSIFFCSEDPISYKNILADPKQKTKRSKHNRGMKWPLPIPPPPQPTGRDFIPKHFGAKNFHQKCLPLITSNDYIAGNGSF